MFRLVFLVGLMVQERIGGCWVRDHDPGPKIIVKAGHTYQTVHRLIRELREEGWIKRRCLWHVYLSPQSGNFRSGLRSALQFPRGRSHSKEIRNTL